MNVRNERRVTPGNAVSGYLVESATKEVAIGATGETTRFIELLAENSVNVRGENRVAPEGAIPAESGERVAVGNSRFVGFVAEEEP